MVINKVQIGAFGKLKNLDLEFKEGINIVYGENEAGKSTIQALIKAMLYGLNSQKKNISNNPRKKYIPWDSDTAFAKLYYTDSNDNDYIIERTFGKNKKDDKSMIFNSVTGEKLISIDEEAPGKSILGIGEDTFEKTLMINQLNYEIIRGKDDEVMQKLINLQQSGDVNISYHKGIKRLEELKKSITNSRKNGKLDRLVEELFFLKQEQEAVNKLHEENIELILHLNKLKNNKKQLQSEIDLLETRKKEIKNYIELPLMEEIEDIEENLYKELTSVRESDNKLTKLIQKKSEEFMQCEVLIFEFGAFDKLEKDAENRISALEDEVLFLEQKLEEIKDLEIQLINLKSEFSEKNDHLRKDDNKYKLLGAVSSVSGSIAFVIGLLTILLYNTLFYTLIIIGSFFLAGGAFLFIHKSRNFTKFKGYTMEISLKIEEKESILKELYAEDIPSKINRNRSILENIYKCCEVKSALEFKDKLNSYKELKEYIAKLREDLYDLKEKKANNKLNIIYCEQKIKDYLIEKIDFRIKKLVDKLLIVEKDIRNEENKIQNIFGEKRKISNINEDIEETKMLIKKYENKLNVINYTEELLKESFQELQQSFGPKLNTITGHILKHITDGKYSSVFIGEDYSIKLIEPEGGSIKEATYLSSGTYDQIYLSLRLAIAELIFNGIERYPLIFDDAFIQYDDERLKNVLGYLSNYSKKHQIIIFTCQSREYEYITDSYNFTKL